MEDLLVEKFVTTDTTVVVLLESVLYMQHKGVRPRLCHSHSYDKSAQMHVDWKVTKVHICIANLRDGKIIMLHHEMLCVHLSNVQDLNPIQYLISNNNNNKDTPHPFISILNSVLDPVRNSVRKDDRFAHRILVVHRPGRRIAGRLDAGADGDLRDVAVRHIHQVRHCHQGRRSVAAAGHIHRVRRVRLVHRKRSSLGTSAQDRCYRPCHSRPYPCDRTACQSHPVEV